MKEGYGNVDGVLCRHSRGKFIFDFFGFLGFLEIGYLAKVSDFSLFEHNHCSMVNRKLTLKNPKFPQYFYFLYKRN